MRCKMEPFIRIYWHWQQWTPRISSLLRARWSERNTWKLFGKRINPSSCRKCLWADFLGALGIIEFSRECKWCRPPTWWWCSSKCSNRWCNPCSSKTEDMETAATTDAREGKTCQVGSLTGRTTTETTVDSSDTTISSVVGRIITGSNKWISTRASKWKGKCKVKVKGLWAKVKGWTPTCNRCNNNNSRNSNKWTQCNNNNRSSHWCNNNRSLHFKWTPFSKCSLKWHHPQTRECLHKWWIHNRHP